METEEVETQEQPEQLTEEATTEEVVETQEAETIEEEDNFYSPDEMRDLSADNVDTARIPPEMQAMYQAMQAPITRKNQELSDKLKDLEQGEAPLQETQPQEEVKRPSLDEMASQATLQKLNLDSVPEPWDENYQSFILEMGDTRRDLRESATKREAAMSEMNTFKAGFTPEQFQQIDEAAETKMYQLLADPATRKEGQRVQQAINQGDTATVLAFVRDTAKSVLSKQPVQIKTTPPTVDTPSGHAQVTAKDPNNMSYEEYKASRMGG